MLRLALFMVVGSSIFSLSPTNGVSDNKRIFATIRSFYYGIYHDDSRNIESLVIAMYETDKEQLLIKVMKRSGIQVAYGYISNNEDGKSAELKQAELARLKLSFDCMPLSISYMGKRYTLVDQLKLGPVIDVP